MNTHAPLPFPLNQGVDVYNPPVVNRQLAFWQLMNVEPRLNRLFASRGYSPFQTLSLSPGDFVVDFGFYTISGQRLSNLYLFTKTSVYLFDYVSLQFDPTPIYTGFANNDFPYVKVPWYDALYVTKPGGPYIKLQRGVATVVANAPFAKYGIDASSHVFLANVSTVSGDAFTQVKWSDLDAPEDFLIDPNNSEADFFDLEPSNNDITGLSYQRGNPLIYSDTTIWLAEYRGFPRNFQFTPLFPGLGNIFHYSVVRNKEIDFFIGADNIYALNGFQPVEIGDGIFDRFINDVKIEDETRVIGRVNTRKTEIFWTYKRVSDSSLHSIVFNYKENKWSERDPQNLRAWFDTPRTSFRGYGVINDLVEDINDYDEMINDLNQGDDYLLPQLAGVGAEVAQLDDALVKLDETEFAHAMETHDLYLQDIGEVGEIHKTKLEFTGAGDPNIVVKIGTRLNQSDDIVWSAAIAVNRDTDGSLSFFHRAEGQGKYMRFRFEWNNDATNYINDLRLLSWNTVEKDANLQEK